MTMEYLSDPWEVLLENYAQGERRKELDRILEKLREMKQDFEDAHATHKALMMEEVIYTLEGF
jgi:hypothetical protein